jgi:site-specific recombinase XerD
MMILMESGQGTVAVLQPGPLAGYVERARNYASKAKSERTLAAYQSDWNDFVAFCRQTGQGSLPAAPETVALYLTYLVDERKRKASTLARRVAAISQVHQAAGFPTPTAESVVRSVLAGIRRVHGSEQTAKMALSPELLKKLVAKLPDTLRGRRDRALLLVGFAGALRRSELVALAVRDVAFEAEGLVLTVRRSKTDPNAEGQLVGIPYGEQAETCPVRTLQAWLEAAKITEGAVFRPIERWSNRIEPRPLEDRRVATLLKTLVGRAGLDPKHFAGHSLRSGLATAAAAGGASERAIMDQTRHKSVKQVRRYIQRGSLFRDNAAKYTGV